MSTRRLLQKLWQRRLVRFLCVGSLNTLTDATLLNIFVFVFGLKLLLANICSASIAIVISYILNHKIVFQHHTEMNWLSFAKFVAVTGLSILFVQSVVIYGFEHVITLRLLEQWIPGLSVHQHQILQVNFAKLLAVGSGMVWNFVLYHLVVFQNLAEVDDPSEGVIPV